MTELSTNATPPIGGVISPIIRLKMTIEPNCSGSIPNATATGSRIGVTIRSADVGSRIIPSRMQDDVDHQQEDQRVGR